MSEETPSAMHDPSVVLYLLIVACEVAFWLILLLSLVVRYILQRETASRRLLLSLPAVDVLLFTVTTLDLKAGRPATMAHGLAAAYVGFTLAFGSLAVRWADAHFAHRFAAGAAPAKAPSRGWKAVRYELELWLRCIVAWIIAFALLAGLIAYVGDDAITTPLRAWYAMGLGCIGLWSVFGPVWSLVFFRRESR
jgi:hypothetical protein